MHGSPKVNLIKTNFSRVSTINPPELRELRVCLELMEIKETKGKF
jgi:hypothetical protein